MIGLALVALLMLSAASATLAAVGLETAVVVVFVLLLGWVLVLQQRRATARMLQSLRRLDAARRADRKDASRWEWRIAQALDSSAIHAVRGLTERSTGTIAGSVQVLKAAAIFDRAYYEATQRRKFTDDDAALLHFVEVGMPALVSPSPLLEPARLPADVRAAYRASDVQPLLSYLRRPMASLPTLSDFFSPGLIEAVDAETAVHPGGCLGWFIDRARETDLLPSRTVHARWAEFRSGIGSALVDHRRAWQASEPRSSDEWDHAAELQWKRDLEADVTGAPAETGKLSVIMPVWNRAQAVSVAIASVQAQDWADWELLVVDDGSDDDTPQVLAAIAADDSRVRVISTSHAGASAARNRGLQESTGLRVAFLDADNRWRPDFLRLAHAAMQRDSLRAVYAGTELHRGEEVLYRAFDGDRDALMTFNHIDLNVLVIDRQLALDAGAFDTSLPRWSDHDFALRVSALAEPALLPFIGCDYDDGDDKHRITHRESGAWEWVVLDKAWSQWERASEAAPTRVPGRVSVVMPTKDDVAMTVRAVRSVCETARDADVEVIVVDNGSALETRIGLAGALCGEPRVRIESIHRNLNFAIGSNVGLTRSSGELVLFLNNDTVARPGWLEPLLRAIEDPEVVGVQPLLVYPDESIQSAGTVWVAREELPVHFLAGQPPEDAVGAAEHPFPAITAAAALFRAVDLLAVRGFDPRYRNGMEDVDLCLRLREERGGIFRVVPESVIEHHEGETPGRSVHKTENRRLFLQRWHGRLPMPSTDIFSAHGLAIERLEHDDMEIPSPRPIFGRDRATGMRRWGIRYAAVGGAKGDRWGDTAFAESLADALRALGQEVVTYRHGPNAVVEGIRDDVSVVLRGIDRIDPVPSALNILWVISHPDAVSDEELRAFDLAYAASNQWAKKRSGSSGTYVGSLLQCTDARRFAPETQDSWPSRPSVFVGGVHPGRRRRVVADALAAGIDLRVIGGGWAGSLSANVLESDHVPNEGLPEVYRSAFRVLADHWASMAEEGFIQNRVFDAVAAGAPVVSDPVVGLEDVFGEAVAIYRSPSELAALCAPGSAHPAGDAIVRTELAHRIRAEHSFAARARELLAAVERIDAR